MNSEYECKAWINGKLVDVVASYEADYPKALMDGIYEKADGSNDLTDIIHPDEYDRIYGEILVKIVEDTVSAAEMSRYLER